MLDLSSPYRIRVLMVVAALVVVSWILWSSRQALIPFMIGAVIAYLIAPIVYIFEAAFPRQGFFAKISRASSILFTYLIGIGIVGLAGYYLVPELSRETIRFIEQLPNYWQTVQRESNVFLDYYERDVPEQVREHIENNLGAIGSQIANGVRTGLMMTIDALSSFFGFAAGLALLPLWMFYVLKDQEDGKRTFYSMFSPHLRQDAKNIVEIIDNVLSRYIRGQLFISVCVGVATGTTMWFIGIEPPIVLGLLAFFTNLIPILGPVIAFFIIALVALATAPDQILLVAGAFVVIQQLESTFLVPRVHGQAVRVNPAIVMILVVIGSAMWGLWGMIVILPVAATLRDVFVYIYHRVGEEQIVPTEKRSEILKP